MVSPHSPHPAGRAIVPLTLATPGSGTIGSTGTRANALSHDLACGILVGIYEVVGTVVTLDAITVSDSATRATTTQRNWLVAGDPIGRLARDCFEAKLKMSGVQIRGASAPWGRAQTVKSREELGAAFRDARRRLCELLTARGVTTEARRHGMRVLADG